jgi:hypothetical protein
MIAALWVLVGIIVALFVWTAVSAVKQVLREISDHDSMNSGALEGSKAETTVVL